MPRSTLLPQCHGPPTQSLGMLGPPGPAPAGAGQGREVTLTALRASAAMALPTRSRRSQGQPSSAAPPKLPWGPALVAARRSMGRYAHPCTSSSCSSTTTACLLVQELQDQQFYINFLIKCTLFRPLFNGTLCGRYRIRSLTTGYALVALPGSLCSTPASLQLPYVDIPVLAISA